MLYCVKDSPNDISLSDFKEHLPQSFVNSNAIKNEIYFSNKLS